MRGADHPHEPLPGLIAITALRPTQVTVGRSEVDEKRRRWRDVKDKRQFLSTHRVPVLLGPNRHSYMLDHHHLARALLDEGVTQVAVTVLADLSHLSNPAFWTFLDDRGWCHPYDDRGNRIEFDLIPRHIVDLSDDPFRSLARETRRRGGFTKDLRPFSEFVWADFLRLRIKRRLVEHDFETAVAEALGLVQSREAARLPGWHGPGARGDERAPLTRPSPRDQLLDEDIARAVVHDAVDPGLQFLPADGGDDRDVWRCSTTAHPLDCL